jgi:hypothetical protein
VDIQNILVGRWIIQDNVAGLGYVTPEIKDGRLLGRYSRELRHIVGNEDDGSIIDGFGPF